MVSPSNVFTLMTIHYLSVVQGEACFLKVCGDKQNYTGLQMVQYARFFIYCQTVVPHENFRFAFPLASVIFGLSHFSMHADGLERG